LTRAGLTGDDVYFDMAGGGVGYERLSEMALQIAKRNPDVVIAFGNAAARAARRATSKVPVVMVGVADPVEDGLIGSLGRPGGNLTGLTIPYEQLVAKQIELLKEIQPAFARAAIFWNPELEGPEKRRGRIETAIRGLGVELHLVEIRYARDLERAFATTPVARAEALVLPEQQALLRREISRWLDVVRTAPADVYERAASYAVKLLRGGRPHDLPVEEPSRFELVISRITAKALGLTIPQSLLARADKVIE
jgi:putative ABC transport system substrate-binding protein